MFDMDNTLLQSRIDYAAMKRDVFAYLRGRGYLADNLPVADYTTSMLIERAREAGMTDAGYAGAMDIATRHELAGMRDASLEEGAGELLSELHAGGALVLAVVTNNSFAAAQRALDETGVSGYIELIVGREQMAAMKPSPSGYLHVLEQFAHLTAGEWISAGDSWIDGKASADAGIPFVSYRTSLDEMAQKGVYPIGRIERIADIRHYVRG